MSTSSHSHGDIPCPDPSVHPQLARDSGLQNSASKAALLAAESRHQSKASEPKIDPFGPDGKLSSASAATSLKYAKATDLPSFPVVGIEAQNSGNTAANLANANHKPFEWWKPEGESSSASKAATLATNKGANLNLWQYKPDGTGFSAASQAMAAKSSSPQLDYGYTEDGHKKALLAATLSTRKKANAAPTFEEPPVYPDSGNSAYNSLNAASVAHRQVYTPMSDRGNEASRIQYARGVSASQYGSAPVIDSEEKRHEAALHAAAVSAAKSLYDIEKPAMERIAAGDAAATRAHGETYDLGVVNTSSDPLKLQATNYLKVHEAAQKLAAERLAKLDPDGVMAYQEHYGYGNRGQAAKLSTKGSRRERMAAWPGPPGDPDSSDDEANAARVRNRTRGLNQQVASIDDQKRTKDREDLMAAAQRSVQARMSLMDEQVFNSTGKMSPAMMKEWEAKAQAKASADSAQRMQNTGKVHIGGGKYMDQSEIDAIAAARMQPTLDQLTATAEAQRVRDAEIKADQDRKKDAARAEKESVANVKAQQKMVHSQEKARIQAEKDAEKAEKRRVKEEQKAHANDSKNAEATRLAQEKEAARLAKDQEAEEAKRTKDAQVEADRLQAEEVKAEKDADKAAIAETEAAEEIREAEAHAAQADTEAAEAAREADARNAQLEAEAEAKVEAHRASTEDVSPGAGTRAVASIEADRPSTATTIKPATTSTTKPDSKVRGFFSRIRGSKEAPASAIASSGTTEDASGEAFKHGTGAHDESAELSSRAKGKQRADSEERTVISPIEASDDEGVARTSVTSDDKWSEARDQFEVEETPRASTGSPAMGGSKFQEDL